MEMIDDGEDVEQRKNRDEMLGRFYWENWFLRKYNSLMVNWSRRCWRLDFNMMGKVKILKILFYFMEGKKKKRREFIN